MHRRLISCAVLVLATLGAHAAQHASDTTTQLPRNVRPRHYDVALTPDAAAGAFSASVTITLDVLAISKSITLNAADLRFRSATLTGAHGKAQAAAISVNPNEQTATFTFARPLAKGSYRLTLHYTGVIGTQPVGMFSVDYDTVAGHKRALYTQFENSDARRVIPSWDEPLYKASFALEATVPAADMAVSNMPVTTRQNLPDGRVKVRFGTTPTMSTYLLFFGLGDFERASASVDGTELGVITQRGALAQGAFALDSAKAILREYNDYFGVRYPLPKLDNIAAPGRSQFFGAMENWGAIFTFEHDILLDPAFSTQHDKQESFATAAHEMAHQWFGNLVTMRWWDDLWLNEGFASWMEARATQRLHPEWQTAIDAVNVREEAMERDSLASTHPVVQRIVSVDQASQAFDDVTYKKGQSVIGMLERYVGEDAWRDGVRAYMRAHAYGNTVSDDLWNKVEQAAHTPVKAIAHDFTLQPGIPLIRLERVVCKDGNSELTLSQGEFSRDLPGKAPLRWRVPVIAEVAGTGKPARTLIEGGKGQLTLAGCGPVLLNAGQSGYFRSLYGRAEFGALAGAFTRLAPIDQLGLMSDSWSMGLAGQEPLTDFLDLAAQLEVQADPQVWSKVASVFGAIHAYYKGNDERQRRFDAYAGARLRKLMAQVGWDARAGEADAVANLRGAVIDTLSTLGDAGVIDEARRRYGAANDASNGALRKVILGVVAAHADGATWDALHAAARKETTPMLKDQYYALLASAGDATLARRALELALTSEPGATNSAEMVDAVANVHPELAFDFALAHMDAVLDRVDSTSRSRYFPRLAANSARPDTIDKLRTYASAHLDQGARGDAEAAMAGIAFRIKVRAERLPQLDTWLAARH